MQSSPGGPRRSGPEAELVLDALRLGLLGRFGQPDAVHEFHEPAMEVGLPDLVIARARPNWTPSPGRGRLTDRHLRILHQVHRLRFTSTAGLVALTCFSRSQVTRILADLIDIGAVRETASGVRARALDDVFALSAIVAIEAKISDWRGAIDQAVRNTWFASQPYIMLPARKCTTAALDHARTAGVGVFTVSATAVHLRVRPRPFPLPCSYGSWQVNEWAQERRMQAAVAVA